MNGGAGAWPATTMNGPLKASHRSCPPMELGWIGCPSIRAAREKVVSHKIVPSHYFSTPKFYSRWEGGDERIESPFHRRNTYISVHLGTIWLQTHIHTYMAGWIYMVAYKHPLSTRPNFGPETSCVVISKRDLAEFLSLLKYGIPRKN